MASLHPPQENAAPDDQGDLGFCSRFALAKTIGNGFMNKKFQPFQHQQLDFRQRDISTALVNNDKVQNLKCCVFHNKQALLHSRSSGICYKGIVESH